MTNVIFSVLKNPSFDRCDIVRSVAVYQFQRLFIRDFRILDTLSYRLLYGIPFWESVEKGYDVQKSLRSVSCLEHQSGEHKWQPEDMSQQYPRVVTDSLKLSYNMVTRL